MNETPKYWFATKRYGWGWGVPTAWQGWVVLVFYFSLLAMTAFRFPPHREPRLFVVLLSAFSAVLIAVCWLKGEQPKWRWGGPRT